MEKDEEELAPDGSRSIRGVTEVALSGEIGASVGCNRRPVDRGHTTLQEKDLSRVTPRTKIRLNLFKRLGNPGKSTSNV